MDVGTGVEHFVAALGFAPAYEALRRGHFFQQGNAIISLFELCGRSGEGGAFSGDTVGRDDQWTVLGDSTLWIVEVRVRGDGENLSQTVSVADGWVDVFSSVPDVVFEEVVSMRAVAAKEAHAAAVAAVAEKKANPVNAKRR